MLVWLPALTLPKTFAQLDTSLVSPAWEPLRPCMKRCQSEKEFVSQHRVSSFSGNFGVTESRESGGTSGGGPGKLPGSL